MIIINKIKKLKNKIKIIILIKKNPTLPLRSFFPKKRLINNTNVEKFCTCSYILTLDVV